MFKYILKRTLFFIPTLFIISVFTFLLSKQAPGDPVELKMSGGASGANTGQLEEKRANEQAYIETREKMGLDLPTFYFNITSQAYPDTLYKVPRKSDRDNLSDLVSTYGNWEQISDYFHEVKSFEASVYSIKADTTNFGRIKKIRDNVGEILRSSNSLKIDRLLAEIDSAIHITSKIRIDSVTEIEKNTLEALSGNIKTLATKFETVKSEATPSKKYIPAIHFYGMNQYQRWMFGDKPWYQKKNGIGNHSGLTSDETYSINVKDSSYYKIKLNVSLEEGNVDMDETMEPVIVLSINGKDRTYKIGDIEQSMILGKKEITVEQEFLIPANGTVEVISAELTKKKKETLDAEEDALKLIKADTNIDNDNQSIIVATRDSILRYQARVKTEEDTFAVWAYSLKITELPNYNPRYTSYGFLRGDFGESYNDGRKVSAHIKDAIRWTILINLLAVFIVYFLSVPIGVLSAVKKDTVMDRISTIFLFILYSLPNFWIATILIVFFTTSEYGMDFFPTYGLGLIGDEYGFFEKFWDRAYHLILPVVCSTYGGLAFISRQMRGGMLNVIKQDYIRTAKAKGLSNGVIIWKHAFRNSLIPIITMFASLFPLMMGGSIIIEIIFNIPGMGTLALGSITGRNWPILFTILMFSAILTVIGVLVADLMYAVVDPRISFTKKGG